MPAEWYIAQQQHIIYMVIFFNFSMLVWRCCFILRNPTRFLSLYRVNKTRVFLLFLQSLKRKNPLTANASNGLSQMNGCLIRWWGYTPPVTCFASIIIQHIQQSMAAEKIEIWRYFLFILLFTYLVLDRSNLASDVWESSFFFPHV